MSEEINRLESRIRELEKAKNKIKDLRTLESYTDKEKCENFDKFYNYAREIIEEAASKGYTDDDTSHWCFEMIMELLGKDVWECYNSFVR